MPTRNIFNYDELTWPEVAELPRDTPLVLPLGSGYDLGPACRPIESVPPRDRTPASHPVRLARQWTRFAGAGLLPVCDEPARQSARRWFHAVILPHAART